MMKRMFSICGVTMAMTVILFLTAVPHHHHGERICFAIEHCDHHDHTEECGTSPCSQNDRNDCGHDESSCMLSHGTYLIEAENAGIRISAAQLELHLLAEAVDFSQTLTSDINCRQTIYAEAVEAEYSVEILYGCGLRAPPVF